MAKNLTSETRIRVQDDVVNVAMGRATASVPAAQLEAVIRVLEAARFMVNAAPGRAPADARAVAPVAAPVAVAAPAKGKRGRPRQADDGGKRRSRKRVGDALETWFHDHPGWHPTEQLLDVVRTNRMTDASPKRALMIALGKQKGGLFETDGRGHWRLLGDDSAGPPPSPTPKVRKKPGRKPGSGKAAATGKARGKRAGGARRRGRPSKSADSEGAPESSPPVSSGRLVRVKRGQSRAEVLLTPTEIEQRKQAAHNIDKFRHRWDSSSRTERDRARKNLFGD